MSENNGAGWATNYHETVRELRASLMSSSVMYEKMRVPHSEVTDKWLKAKCADPDAPKPPEAEFAAEMACMMAASYSYTLAALLRFAGEHFGEEIARALAFEADEILTNGDFDNLNADVAVPAEEVAGDEPDEMEKALQDNDRAELGIRRVPGCVCPPDRAAEFSACPVHVLTDPAEAVASGA